jgi:hypothetical protein
MKLEINDAVFQIIGIALIVRSIVILFKETVAPKIK